MGNVGPVWNFLIGFGSVVGGFAAFFGALYALVRYAIGDVKTEIGDVKTEIGDIKKEIGEVKKEIERTNDLVVAGFTYQKVPLEKLGFGQEKHTGKHRRTSSP